jgi:hypothetical protein
MRCLKDGFFWLLEVTSGPHLRITEMLALEPAL